MVDGRVSHLVFFEIDRKFTICRVGKKKMGNSTVLKPVYKRCKLNSILLSTYVGFRPGSRGPFLSGKGPKTISALSLPCGSLRCSARLAAAELARTLVMSEAHTVLANSPNSLVLLGHARRSEEGSRVSEP